MSRRIDCDALIPISNVNYHPERSAGGNGKVGVLGFGLGLVATVFELVRPTRKLRYWVFDAVLLDIGAFIFYQFVVVYWASVLRSHIPLSFKPTHFLLLIPLPLRVVAYYIAGDFSSYWMHRLTHTK